MCYVFRDRKETEVNLDQLVPEESQVPQANLDPPDHEENLDFQDRVVNLEQEEK